MVFLLKSLCSGRTTCILINTKIDSFQYPTLRPFTQRIHCWWTELPNTHDHESALVKSNKQWLCHYMYGVFYILPVVKNICLPEFTYRQSELNDRHCKPFGSSIVSIKYCDPSFYNAFSWIKMVFNYFDFINGIIVIVQYIIFTVWCFLYKTSRLLGIK